MIVAGRLIKTRHVVDGGFKRIKYHFSIPQTYTEDTKERMFYGVQHYQLNKDLEGRALCSDEYT